MSEDTVYETKEEAVTAFVEVYLGYEAEMGALKEDMKEVREALKLTKESPTFTEHLSVDDIKQIVLAIKLLRKEEDLEKVKEFFDKLQEMGVV